MLRTYKSVTTLWMDLENSHLSLRKLSFQMKSFRIATADNVTAVYIIVLDLFLDYNSHHTHHIKRQLAYIQ